MGAPLHASNSDKCNEVKIRNDLREQPSNDVQGVDHLSLLDRYRTSAFMLSTNRKETTHYVGVAQRELELDTHETLGDRQQLTNGGIDSHNVLGVEGVAISRVCIVTSSPMPQT